MGTSERYLSSFKPLPLARPLTASHRLRPDAEEVLAQFLDLGRKPASIATHIRRKAKSVPHAEADVALGRMEALPAHPAS